MRTLLICEETAQILRGLLLNHQDYLSQQAMGEPWEASERESVESLLSMLEPKDYPFGPESHVPTDDYKINAGDSK